MDGGYAVVAKQKKAESAPYSPPTKWDFEGVVHDLIVDLDKDSFTIKLQQLSMKEYLEADAVGLDAVELLTNAAIRNKQDVPLQYVGQAAAAVRDFFADLAERTGSAGETDTDDPTPDPSAT